MKIIKILVLVCVITVVFILAVIINIVFTIVFAGQLETTWAKNMRKKIWKPTETLRSNFEFNK